MSSHPARPLILVFLCATLAAFSNRAHAAFGFVKGHDYTTNYFSRTITEFTSSGASVATITLPASACDELRGLTFAPGGLLYTTAVVGSGFNVLALNSAGVIQKTYTAPTVYAAGNLSFGKIAVDDQYLYVGAQDNLTRFAIGGSGSGTTIYTDNQIYDIKVLPSGNLLVASAYNIKEITTGGAIIRTFNPQGIFFADIRGIEYNAATNDLFVTMLGYSGQSFQLMRFDATSGVLEKQITFNYADDLFLTSTGTLLVGSRTQTPGIFDQELIQVGSLGSASQMFVTQNTVPEPATTGLWLAGAALIGLRRTRAVIG